MGMGLFSSLVILFLEGKVKMGGHNDGCSDAG